MIYSDRYFLYKKKILLNMVKKINIFKIISNFFISIKINISLLFELLYIIITYATNK